MQGLAGSILWITYGVQAGTHLVVLANVMTIVGFGIVIYKMVVHREVATRRVLLIGSAVLAVSLVSASISSTVLALVAVGVGSTGIIPQVGRAARTSISRAFP